MRAILVGLALLALVALSAPLWLPGIGTFLEYREDPGTADVIVVLAGNAPERLRHAARLFQEGRAPWLLVSNERVRSFGMDTTWWDLYRAGYGDVRILQDRIIVLDNPLPESTLDEARRGAALIAERGFKRAILVTDAFHSRRAAMLFRGELRPRGIELRSSPARDVYGLDRWWQSPRAARLVFEEWAKLIVYLPQGVYGLAAVFPPTPPS